jgi:hypothetical protein
MFAVTVVASCVIVAVGGDVSLASVSCSTLRK